MRGQRKKPRYEDRRLERDSESRQGKVYGQKGQPQKDKKASHAIGTSEQFQK